MFIVTIASGVRSYYCQQFARCPYSYHCQLWARYVSVVTITIGVSIVVANIANGVEGVGRYEFLRCWQVPVTVPRVLVAGCPLGGVSGLVAALGRLHLTADWAESGAEAASLLNTHNHRLVILILKNSDKFNAADFIRYSTTDFNILYTTDFIRYFTVQHN